MFDFFKVFEVVEIIIYLITGQVALNNRLGFPVKLDKNFDRINLYEFKYDIKRRFEIIKWKVWYQFLAAITKNKIILTCLNWVRYT